MYKHVCVCSSVYMIQLETLAPEVANYILELETYKREFEIIKHNQLALEKKYLLLKERYDVLVYKVCTNRGTAW
jgi:hypothetical protein